MDASYFEVVPFEECLRLLGAGSIGRIAVVMDVDQSPIVVPTTGVDRGGSTLHRLLADRMGRRRCRLTRSAADETVNGYRVLRDDGTVATEHWAGRVHGLEHPDPQAPITVGVCARLESAAAER
jgi:hypothetical protein